MNNFTLHDSYKPPGKHIQVLRWIVGALVGLGAVLVILSLVGALVVLSTTSTPLTIIKLPMYLTVGGALYGVAISLGGLAGFVWFFGDLFLQQHKQSEWLG